MRVKCSTTESVPGSFDDMCFPEKKPCLIIPDYRWWLLDVRLPSFLHPRSWQGRITQPWLSWTCLGPPVSASRVLRLQDSTLMPRYSICSLSHQTLIAIKPCPTVNVFSTANKDNFLHSVELELLQTWIYASLCFLEMEAKKKTDFFLLWHFPQQLALYIYKHVNYKTWSDGIIGQMADIWPMGMLGRREKEAAV